MSSLNISYVSHKISKVKFRPLISNQIDKSTVFVTGGWDEQDLNPIIVWSVSNSSDDHYIEDNKLAAEPNIICKGFQKGDVTDLLFLTEDFLLSSSSSGDVHLFQFNYQQHELKLSHTWPHLHGTNFGRLPCRGLARRGDDSFATVGEDGKINLLEHIKRNGEGSITKIETNDRCTLNGSKFLDNNNLATIDILGHLKVWDLRVNYSNGGGVASKSFNMNNNEVISLQCLDQHPSQAHLIVVGAENGCLYVCDTRQNKGPLNIIESHKSDVLDIKFHPTLPNNLLTACEDGSLYHYSSKDYGYNLTSSILTAQNDLRPSSCNHWLTWQNQIERQNLVTKLDLLEGNTNPINSLDVCSDQLICGSDGEQLCLFSNIVFC